MSKNKTKFILVIPFTRVTSRVTKFNGKTKTVKAHTSINTDKVQSYRKQRVSSTSSDPFGIMSAGTYSHSSLTCQAFGLLKDSGLDEDFKLKRYYKSKDRIPPKAFRIATGVKGSALFTGTVEDVTDLDTIKTTLALAGLEDVKILDASCAAPIVPKEL